MCSFAWADDEVRPQERAFVASLVRRLKLAEDERAQVEGWLAEPPHWESVDPALVPKDHRLRFLRAVESVIASDGEIADTEREQLVVFARLLR